MDARTRFGSEVVDLRVERDQSPVLAIDHSRMIEEILV